MSYLSLRCCPLCHACSQTSVTTTHPPCLLVRIVFQSTHFFLVRVRHSHVQTTHCLILSCSAPDTSILSSRCRVRMCVLLASPPSVADFTCSYVWCQSFSLGLAPFIYQGRNWAKIYPRKTVSAALGGQPKTDSWPPLPWPPRICSEVPALLCSESSVLRSLSGGIAVFIQRLRNLSREPW